MPYHVFSALVPTLRLEGGNYSATEPVTVDKLTPEMEAQRVNLRIVEVDDKGEPVDRPTPQVQPVDSEEHEKVVRSRDRLKKKVEELETENSDLKRQLSAKGSTPPDPNKPK